MTATQKNAVKNHLQHLQETLCQTLAKADGAKTFLKDEWQRSSGFGGVSQILSDGSVIERGGVNFSHVQGTHLPESATEKRRELKGRSFEAMGISLVIHPRNPYAPTTHGNFRFFISEAKGEDPIWWFGGGFDLTPYYGFEEDCKHWHQVAHDACAPFGGEVYSKYKQWCDDYFFLPHRNEPRGIGGLFFDDLNEWGFEKSFAFVKGVGDAFMKAYLPILERRQNTPYGDRERQFQLYRRGRYVEFNLIYDRGTLFGLQTQGRTESILMSMPPLVRWDYCKTWPKNSPEAQLTDYYLQPRDWLKATSHTQVAS